MNFFEYVLAIFWAMLTLWQAAVWVFNVRHGYARYALANTAFVAISAAGWISVYL